MILDIGGFSGVESMKEVGSQAAPFFFGGLKIGGAVLLLCWTLLLSALGVVMYAVRKLMKTNSLQLALIALIKAGTKVIAGHVALLVAAVLIIVSNISVWYILGGAALLAVLLSVVLSRTIGYALAYKFRKYLQWFAVLRKGKDVYTEMNRNRG